MSLRNRISSLTDVPSDEEYRQHFGYYAVPHSKARWPLVAIAVAVILYGIFGGIAK